MGLKRIVAINMIVTVHHSIGKSERSSYIFFCLILGLVQTLREIVHAQHAFEREFTKGESRWLHIDEFASRIRLNLEFDPSSG